MKAITDGCPENFVVRGLIEADTDVRLVQPAIILPSRSPQDRERYMGMLQAMHREAEGWRFFNLFLTAIPFQYFLSVYVSQPILFRLDGVK